MFLCDNSNYFVTSGNIKLVENDTKLLLYNHTLGFPSLHILLPTSKQIRKVFLILICICQLCIYIVYVYFPYVIESPSSYIK